MTEVVLFIFNQWWQLWETINKDRHGRDLALRLKAKAKQVNHKLQIFYKEYEGKLPQDLKWLFDMTIETHRQKTTAATRQWLNTWKPILRKL